MWEKNSSSSFPSKSHTNSSGKAKQDRLEMGQDWGWLWWDQDQLLVISAISEFVKSLQKTPEQGKSWIKIILMCCLCFSAPLNTKIFPKGFKNIKLPKNPL